MGMSNSDVVRRWGDWNEGGARSNRRDHARGSSMRFQGPVLYSYQAPIARFYKDRFCLIATNRWGVTTAHHINMARREANLPTFQVPYIGGDWNIPDDFHDQNADHLHRELLSEMKVAISNYRTRNIDDNDNDDGLLPYYLRDRVAYAYMKATQYMQLTGAKTSYNFEPLEEILDYVTKTRNEKWAAYIHPKAVAQRERTHARREAKKAFGLA